jgi:capsular exopolysaccharide synthesis family protein
LNKQEEQLELLRIDAEKEGVIIDYKRVLYRAIKYWYVVVLSLITTLSIAFIYNRYAPRIYPVTASIIIKDTEETSGAGEILYTNSIISPHRNYLNELYLIRSYPLIQSVLEELNFGVSFYAEGNILTREIYGDLPFSVEIINKDQIKNFKRRLIILNDVQYQLGPLTRNSTPEYSKSLHTFNFNDTIFYDGLKAVFKLNTPGVIDTVEKSHLIFSYTAPEQVAGTYVGKLKASWAETGAGVINLSVSGTNPKKESDFMTGLIKRYQDHDLEKKSETASRTINFITGQLNEITDSLRQVESVLERFKRKNVITKLDEEASRLYGKLEGVTLQKTEMMIRKNYNQYLISYIQKDQNLDQVILPSSMGLADPILGQLLSSMVVTQTDLKMIGGKDKTDNPLIRERRQRLQEIKNNIIESIRNQENTDKIKSDYISKEINDVEKQLAYLPAAQRQFISISRNYSLLENQYVFLLQKRAEAAISKASTSSDIDPLNPPMVGGPISPKTEQNLMFAIVLGLAFPLLLFILMEYLNSNIQSKEDIEKTTSIPFIGGVGHKNSVDYMAVLSAPKSQVAESFRALRSNLAYFTREKKNITILISSSISGEGKTFTTINLATVLAFSSKKTLIVGADMRRPKLFGDFKLSNTVGLSSYLAGMNNFGEIVQKTALESLDLVSSGPVPPNPSELILRPEMAQFFADAREHYDYIVIDSPPLAIVSDAFVLADYADHLLFLTRQNFTPKNMLKLVDEFYRNGRIKNASILLNDIYQSGLGYGYGYSQGYGYGYGYINSKSNGYYEETPNQKSRPGFFKKKR